VTLTGKHILVTAGPTHEPIDPVRVIANRSSGRQGFAIAAAAADAGARVTLIAGPVSLPTPAGVTRLNVESAEQMRTALASALADADALVMAAAVADFRPANASATKLKKGAGEPESIALTKNPDLIAEIGAARTGPKPYLVGFALETGDDAAVTAYAADKLARKRVDLVVANAAQDSLGRDENRISLVDVSGATPFVSGTKDEVATRILDRVAATLRR